MKNNRDQAIHEMRYEIEQMHTAIVSFTKSCMRLQNEVAILTRQLEEDAMQRNREKGFHGTFKGQPFNFHVDGEKIGVQSLVHEEGGQNKCLEDDNEKD